MTRVSLASGPSTQRPRSIFRYLCRAVFAQIGTQIANQGAASSLGASLSASGSRRVVIAVAHPTRADDGAA